MRKIIWRKIDNGDITIFKDGKELFLKCGADMKKYDLDKFLSHNKGYTLKRIYALLKNTKYKHLQPHDSFWVKRKCSVCNETQLLKASSLIAQNDINKICRECVTTGFYKENTTFSRFSDSVSLTLLPFKDLFSIYDKSRVIVYNRIIGKYRKKYVKVYCLKCDIERDILLNNAVGHRLCKRCAHLK